jgi:putative endonuclease
MYAKGKKGELIAERYMLNRGYQVHFRNKRVGRNEIDLICEKDGAIIFVEVKARTGNSLLKPFESVNRTKQNKILRVADDVAVRHFPDHNYRFDIISIVFRKDKFDIEHIKNAFTAEIANR